jgi:predicted Zn-dependent protease
MGEGPPEYLRTHPVTVSRIAEADSRAQSMPIPPASDGLNFYLAQARLRALVEDYPSKALEQFEYMKQRADMNEAQGAALDYGIAIALQRQGKYQEARSLLLNLMDRGEHLAYEIQLADLDLASGHTAAALDRLAGLYHNFPGNNAISMEYSEALLHSGDKSQADTAAVILRQQILNHDDDPALYALYARASNEAGETVRAKEAIAESYYLRGGVHEAVLQLQELVRRDDLDYYERARVTARLNEYQIELAKMGLDDRHIPR